MHCGRTGNCFGIYEMKAGYAKQHVVKTKLRACRRMPRHSVYLTLSCVSHAATRSKRCTASAKVGICLCAVRCGACSNIFKITNAFSTTALTLLHNKMVKIRHLYCISMSRHLCSHRQQHGCISCRAPQAIEMRLHILV